MGCTLLTKGAEPQCDHGRNAMTVRHTTPPRVASAVARFLLGSLAAIAVIVVGGFFALRAVAITEAERDTRERVEAEGELVEARRSATGSSRGPEGAGRARRPRPGQDPRRVGRAREDLGAATAGSSTPTSPR